MSQGLKNLQTAARSCARRERMLNPSQNAPYQGSFGERDDSAISVSDNIEADYDEYGASNYSRSVSDIKKTTTALARAVVEADNTMLADKDSLWEEYESIL
jgi:hypothetical protein